jgi:hypothetical protein
MSTRQALKPVAEFYPGGSHEFLDDPHRVVVTADGKEWPIGFHTPDELCRYLATEVTRGRMPACAASEAIRVVREWLEDSFDSTGHELGAPAGEGTQSPSDVGHGSPPRAVCSKTAKFVDIAFGALCVAVVVLACVGAWELLR